MNSIVEAFYPVLILRVSMRLNLGLLDPELLNRAISEALRTGGAQTVTTLLPSVRHILLNQSVDSLQPTAQRLYAAGASALTEEELMTVLPRLAEAVG